MRWLGLMLLAALGVRLGLVLSSFAWYNTEMPLLHGSPGGISPVGTVSR